MKRWVRVLAILSLAAPALAGCGAVGGVVSVASTAVGVAGTVVETAADVATAPLR